MRMKIKMKMKMKMKMKGMSLPYPLPVVPGPFQSAASCYGPQPDLTWPVPSSIPADSSASISNDEIARCSRHLIMPRSLWKGKRLKASSVLCIGLVTGSPIALYLTRRQVSAGWASSTGIRWISPICNARSCMERATWAAKS